VYFAQEIHGSYLWLCLQLQFGHLYVNVSDLHTFMGSVNNFFFTVEEVWKGVLRLSTVHFVFLRQLL
jgi:hypothetical protein